MQILQIDVATNEIVERLYVDVRIWWLRISSKHACYICIWTYRYIDVKNIRFVGNDQHGIESMW